MNKQKIFDFNIKKNYENDDFFVSKSNQLAHKVLFYRFKNKLNQSQPTIKNLHSRNFGYIVFSINKVHWYFFNFKRF